MTGAVHDSERHPWAPSLCILEGKVARLRGKRLRDNPYPKGLPEARCWRHGHTPVSREAISRRSHDERGDRWPAADEALLAFAGDDLDLKTLGAILGVSHAAVRNKRHRMRREAAHDRRD